MNDVADLATSPSEVTITTYEGPVTIAVNCLARLAIGQISPISPTAMTVSGASVLQPLRGTEVTAGYSYLLIVSFGDGAGNVQASFTSINVPI
jgi:hypothetical protein